MLPVISIITLIGEIEDDCFLLVIGSFVFLEGVKTEFRKLFLCFTNKSSKSAPVLLAVGPSHRRTEKKTAEDDFYHASVPHQECEVCSGSYPQTLYCHPSNRWEENFAVIVAFAPANPRWRP